MKSGTPSPANQAPELSDWSISSVPDSDIQFLERMDERGAWDSVTAGHFLGRLMPAAGTRITLVGQENSAHSSAHIGLFMDLVESMRIDRRVNAAVEPNPGLVVYFEDVPTPDALRDFLAENSLEAGYMTGWSESGSVPYVILDGNTPLSVEHGMLDSTTAARTSASRLI